MMCWRGCLLSPGASRVEWHGQLSEVSLVRHRSCLEAAGYRAGRLHPGWLRTQLASAGAAASSPVKGATRREHLDPAFLLERGSGRGGWGALGVVPGVDSGVSFQKEGHYES